MDSDVNIDMGSSVNKVTLVLWRSETIGDVAKDKLKQLRDKSEKANKEDLQAIIDEAYELGDSVERVLFIKTIMDKQ
jgi:hypothetical protein